MLTFVNSAQSISGLWKRNSRTCQRKIYSLGFTSAIGTYFSPSSLRLQLLILDMHKNHRGIFGKTFKVPANVTRLPLLGSSLTLNTYTHLLIYRKLLLVCLIGNSISSCRLYQWTWLINISGKVKIIACINKLIIIHGKLLVDNFANRRSTNRQCQNITVNIRVL